MAKRVFIVLIVAGLLVSCASMQPVQEEEKTFSDVYEVPGFLKDKLFDMGKMWIAQNFKSAKAVIEYENKENGTIIGNGFIKYPCSGFECVAKSDWRIGFNMKYETKDDKFKITFSNLILSWPARVDSLGFHEANTGTPMYSKGDYDAAKPVLLGFGEQIKEYIEKGAATEKNW